MKTTIELPDALMLKAKAVAAERRTTLKAMMEHALSREINYTPLTEEESSLFTYNDYGFPVLKRDANQSPFITNEMIYQLMDETENA